MIPQRFVNLENHNLHKESEKIRNKAIESAIQNKAVEQEKLNNGYKWVQVDRKTRILTKNG